METTGKIKFDVTQEHRIGGNGASYVVKYYKNAVEGANFQQKIAMGNAYGFHGHPRRKVLENGKLTYKPVLVPHETEAIPTHVCRYAAMEGKYCIHEEQFLTDHEEGKRVLSLWKGKTGGFSSRASTIGGYGGKYYPTKLNEMAGFDFVHDRSYRYNSREGVIAAESVGMPTELTVEYLVENLGIEDKAAHFICNGGFCPRPEDIALEQAVFRQVLDDNIAIEEAHKLEVARITKKVFDDGFQKGIGENIDDEKAEFNRQLEAFTESYDTDRKKERSEAVAVAVECVRSMPRKPPLGAEFYSSIAPSLIANGTERTAIESALWDILQPLTGYKPSDFIVPQAEYVNVNAERDQVPAFRKRGDSFLNPI